MPQFFLELNDTLKEYYRDNVVTEIDKTVFLFDSQMK